MQNIYLTIYRQINMAVDPFFVYSLLSVNNQKYIYKEFKHPINLSTQN